jgi:formylglycine-generating enzyme
MVTIGQELKNPLITRRAFLKHMSITAAAGALNACVPQVSSPLSTHTPLPSIKTSTVTDNPTATATLTPTPTEIPTEAPPTAIPSPANTLVPEEMVLVEAGSFMMGSEEGYDDEVPLHRVNITRTFYIGKYPVTHNQFIRYHETKNFDWADNNLPEARIDWMDAVEYCNWLSKRNGFQACYSGKGKVTQCDFTASGYRLPTEAEWEYAARGGQASQGFTFAGSNDPYDIAWFAENSDDQPHPVGLKMPNELGIHDMCGNMFELVWDWYAEDTYARSPLEDPTGPVKGTEKVRRSGNYGVAAFNMRSTFRSYDGINYPMNGFRVVRTA